MDNAHNISNSFATKQEAKAKAKAEAKAKQNKIDRNDERWLKQKRKLALIQPTYIQN